MLTEGIDTDTPDLVVFKSMGYRLATWLVANSRRPYRLAFIVGGTARDTVETLASYVLVESEQQISQYFRRRISDGSVAVPCSGTCVHKPRIAMIACTCRAIRPDHRCSMSLLARY